MKYFFVLGNHPALSVAEILAVGGFVESQVSYASPELLVIETSEPLDAAQLMGQLGGTVKIGLFDLEFPNPSPENLAAPLTEYLESLNPSEIKDAGRITFGISVYGLTADACLKKRLAPHLKGLGLKLKKHFAEGEGSCRWVPNTDGPTLSSAVVYHNRLVSKIPGAASDGHEIVIAEKSGLALVGRTLVVQPLEDFSKRDYGRPGRDTFQGMLPPKLARMMLHFAGKVEKATILDPFCGSGTVLTEALLLGANQVYGGDKNAEAVRDTLKNIAWTESHGLADATTKTITQTSDARATNTWVPAASIDHIVTETYLGPPRRGHESRAELQSALFSLELLYLDSLASFKKVLKPGGTIVFALPLYRFAKELHGINAKRFEAAGFELVPILSGSLAGRVNAEFTNNKGLKYGRPDQYVWREILKLKMK